MPCLENTLRQFAQGQFDPFDQPGIGIGPFAGSVQCAVQRVVDGQQVAGKARAAIILGLAAVLVGTLAGVFGIRQRTHEAVAIVIALDLQRGDAAVIGRFGQPSIPASSPNSSPCRGPVCVSFIVLPLSAGQHPANQLRGVIDDRHDAAIVQSRRPDHPNRPHNFSVSVHIG